MEKLIKKYKRQIERYKEKIKKLEIRKEHLSIFGYQEMGYFKGRLSAWEDMIDDLEELLKKGNKNDIL